MTVNRRTLIGTVCAISVFGVPLISSAQTGTRSNPIKIVVPYPPGGPLDVSARAIAEAVHADLGNVIVDNRPGAGGNRGVTYLAQQKPDGMTLCVGAVATHAVNPNLFKKLPYDPIKDFEPVTLIAHVPNVLVVTPEFQQRTGIKSVKDLIAYCKANPDKLNYASGGNGSAGHMAGELLKAKAGIKMVHVPYAGASAAQLSVLAGQTDLISTTSRRPPPTFKPANWFRLPSPPPNAQKHFPMCPLWSKPAWQDLTSRLGTVCSCQPRRLATLSCTSIA